MTSITLSPKSALMRMAAAALIALPLFAAPAAFADDRRDGRGHDRGGWDRGRGHDRDWNRGRHDDRRWDRGRDYRRHDRNDRFSLSLNFGRPYYYSAPSYAYPAYPRYYSNAYGLRPHECFTQTQWDHWRGYPAEVAVRVCADGYGATYVVAGSQRLIRYR